MSVASAQASVPVHALFFIETGLKRVSSSEKRAPVSLLKYPCPIGERLLEKDLAVSGVSGSYILYVRIEPVCIVEPLATTSARIFEPERGEIFFISKAYLVEIGFFKKSIASIKNGFFLSRVTLVFNPIYPSFSIFIA